MSIDVDVASVHVVNDEHVRLGAHLAGERVVDGKLEIVLLQHLGLEQVRDVVDRDPTLAAIPAHAVRVEPPVCEAMKQV